MNDFLITKEYRRFAEFCDACRRHRYIGLCYGPPGVGKTLSARHYSQWDLVESRMDNISQHPPIAGAGECRTILYTPSVSNTPQGIERAIHNLYFALHDCVFTALAVEENQENNLVQNKPRNYTELIVVDEADRLKVTGLEQLRDIYDRWKVGLIFIGMPGIEKRLTRYPQLYSRVGFVHQFKPLSSQEMRFILEHKWKELGLNLQPSDFTDSEAIAAIIRITGGNFRLLQRLFTQIERILQINDLHLITKEVVETAREGLVIGSL